LIINGVNREDPFPRTGRVVDTSQRAAEDAMPWSETNVVEQRMQFVMEPSPRRKT
jgi:hypothetical protein